MEWFETGERDAKIVALLKKQGAVVAPRERNVENRLREGIEDCGGMCLKWVSPRNPGVPDRVIVYRNGLYLVEAKRIDGKLTNSQKAMFPVFYAMGIPIYILDTRAAVDDWIDDLILGRIPGRLKDIPWNFAHTVFRPAA